MRTTAYEFAREIKKHLIIYGLFIRFSVMSQMEYRWNFIGNMAMETGYLCAKLSYVVVVYRSNVTINGFTPDAMLFFIGTFVMLTGGYAGLFMINNFRLRTTIRDGNLDLLMTKPVSLQFLVTMRQANLTLLGVDVIAGIIIVVIAWSRLGIAITLWTVGGYIALLMVSLVVSYSLFLLPNLLSFWLLNTSSIANITDSFWDFNSMPMVIYSGWIRLIGVFILPIFVLTNFPTLFVLDKMPTHYLIWAALLPILLLFLVRWVWLRGLRNYNSASS
ncbi:MAG: ABC-2 family transporter protein [Anaerolineae bacterium]|nr:ABC-2 family transporter protein [Anaerolineae bacterium]